MSDARRSLVAVARLACVLLAALGVTACAPRLAPPSVSFGEPRPLPLVHTSVDRTRWYIVVDTETAGRRLFFLDTGYAHSTCDDAFVADLGVQTRGRIRIRGESGHVRATRARLPALTLGGHTVEKMTCVARDLATTSSIADPPEVAVAGVLGSDVLRRFRVVIDPETASVGLFDPHDAERIERGEDTVRVRRELRVGTRPVVVARIDGRRARFIVDTGANTTFVDGSRLGLEATHVRKVAVSGTGGSSVVDLAFYRIDGLTLAGATVEGLTVADRARPCWEAALLGLDVLREFRQEYDFGRGIGRFTRVGASETPAYRELSAPRTVAP